MPIPQSSVPTRATLPSRETRPENSPAFLAVDCVPVSFLLFFSPFFLSFLQTSVPALPALLKRSPAPGSRESLFFLPVPWANIWFAFPHFLPPPPLPPSQSTAFTSHHSTSLLLPAQWAPPTSSPLPPHLSPGLRVCGLGGGGRKRGTDSKCLPRVHCKRIWQNLPRGPHCLHSPLHLPPKTFLF